VHAAPVGELVVQRRVGEVDPQQRTGDGRGAAPAPRRSGR
jgi:hypothetical protein